MPNNSHVLRQTDHLEVRLGLRSRLPFWLHLSAPPLRIFFVLCLHRLCDIRVLLHDVSRHGLDHPSHVSAESFSLHVPPSSLRVMVFIVAFLLIPGADTLPLAASGHLERLRSIEVPLRRLAKPASTCGLDWPPSSQRQRIGKTFSKTTIPANIFSSRHANFAAT
jgi:hypothetical protein